jgi:hypothetical protein
MAKTNYLIYLVLSVTLLLTITYYYEYSSFSFYLKFYSNKTTYKETSDAQERQQRRPNEATATPKRGNSDAQKNGSAPPHDFLGLSEFSSGLLEDTRVDVLHGPEFRRHGSP